MKLQDPEFRKQVDSLYEFVKSEEAQDSIERRIVEDTLGLFAQVEGIHDAVESHPQNPFIGDVHTHFFVDEMHRDRNWNQNYGNQCFSLADISNYLAHVVSEVHRQTLRGAFPIDVSKYYSGVVAAHGLYLLSINKVLRNEQEAIGFMAAMNSGGLDNPFLGKGFDTLMKEQING